MLENGPLDTEGMSLEEKYHHAEMQIAKFRSQAGRVRELLSVKLKEFESKIAESEQKREELQEKVQKLEGIIKDKDEAITALREKITCMREARLKETEVWEERDKKIKEWIRIKFTGLLKELEDVKAQKESLEAKLTKSASFGNNVTLAVTNSDESGGHYEEIFDQIIADLRRPSLPPNFRPVIEDMKLERPHSPWDDGVPPKPLPRRRSYTPSTSPTHSPSSLSPPMGRSKIPVRAPPPTGPPPPLPRARTSPSSRGRHLGLPSSKEDFGSHSSLNDDVFDGQADDGKVSRIPQMRRKSSSSVSDMVQAHSSESSSEPMYFTLKETYYGVGYEEETKTPVYATLKGVAAQIRDTPFSGESTDSEEDNDNSMSSRKGTTTSHQSSTIKASDEEQQGKKPLRTCAPYTAQNMRLETLEKASYLTKLGGRIKNWKRRWFVLFEGKLSYYKTQNDMQRKPLGQISLDDVIEIVRSPKLHTFEMLTASRTYYMTADSAEDCDDWIRVLRKSLRRFAGARLMSRVGEKTIYAGWVTRVKGGLSRHCWCVLKERSLIFYRSDIEQAPVNALNLREVIKVTPMEVQSSQSEITANEDDGRCTLVIQCIKDSHLIYLVIPSKEEMEEWLENINSLCSGAKKEEETEFENLVKKLMSVDGDSGNRLWKSNVLVHSRNLIREPLTTLSTGGLKEGALKLFKSIHLFSTTTIRESAIDYHLALAQDTLQLCFQHPELQTEIYCQLIKQTTKYRHRQGMNRIQSFLTGTSDWLTDHTAGDQTIDLSPVPEAVYLQCWQLLALCTSLFLPKLHVLWLVKMHLSRNENDNTDIGRYAMYCQRNLERTLKNGDREARPSRLEVLSIVLRNPYYRPLPMSIAVHLVNGTYQVFGFDGSTTVAEFCERINSEIGIRDCSESGYALFSDNPIAPVEHCLQFDLKLADVIAKWEQAMKNFLQGKVEKQKQIKLTYKCRLYFKSLVRGQTEKERYLLVYMVNDSIMSGHLLPTSENVCYLAALLAQIELGNYVDQMKKMDNVMSKFVPERLISEESGQGRRKTYKNVADFWSTLRLKSVKECVNLYLANAKKIPFFGAKLFEAKEKIQSSGKKEEFVHVWLAVDEDRVTILNFQERDIRGTFGYTSIATFGGYKDDFMLVVQDSDDPEKTERHLFEMPHAKVLETTFLVASYINAVVTRRGLNLELKRGRPRHEVPPSGQMARHSPLQLWDMESAG